MEVSEKGDGRLEKETAKQSSLPPVSPYLQMGRLPRVEAWLNHIAWSGFAGYWCLNAYWASQGSCVCHSLLSVSPASHICFSPSIHFVLLSSQPFPSPRPSLIPFLALLRAHFLPSSSQQPFLFPALHFSHSFPYPSPSPKAQVLPLFLRTVLFTSQFFPLPVISSSSSSDGDFKSDFGVSLLCYPSNGW